VPLGTSRKFWYLEELSVPMSSVTTRQEKRLYIDPRMLPLIENRRVALVDDVISSGSSIIAGLSLLAASGIRPAVIGAAMLQSLAGKNRRFRAGMAGAGEGCFFNAAAHQSGRRLARLTKRKFRQKASGDNFTAA
jgi:adenine/guanine phosphoribosyltransferase-like PRPP-binding protein